MPSPDRHPELAPRQFEVRCGYAPRSIHLPYDHDQGKRAFFVGCKDGSVQAALPYEAGALDYAPPVRICKKGLSVRAISEWEWGWLTVGRLGSTIQLIDVRGLQRGETRFPEHEIPLLGGEEAGRAGSPQEAVRAMGWIDRRRRFVSLRHHGTLVLPYHPIAGDDPAPALEASLAEKGELLLAGGEPLTEALFIIPLADNLFVIPNHRGEVFTWDGQIEEGIGTVHLASVWAGGEEPGIVNDVAVLWSDHERQQRERARGVFLATDRGVYLLYLADGGRGALRSKHLSLTGLGAVCMAIAYAEPSDENLPGYLWTADSRGDSYLFWSRNQTDPSRIDFQASGISGIGSQALLAIAWYRGDCLVVGQALRNDRIAFNEYERVAPRLHPVRWLLSEGELEDLDGETSRISRVEELGGFFRPGERWPPHARLAELFEYLAEDEERFRILLDFLGDPAPGIAGKILAHLVATPAGTEDAPAAVRLWTLCLLGIFNRPPAKVSAAQREAAYLGIIRWFRVLLHQADGVAAATEWREVMRELELSIHMVRKWGLFGEANSRRKSFAHPLEILRREDSPEQRLDALTYEALLFDRGIDLMVEERAGHMPGRQAWRVVLQQLRGRSFCAVSWGWGGVEVYEMVGLAEPPVELDLQIAVHVNKDDLGLYRFDPKPFPARARRAPETFQRHKAGYSRAILLGKVATPETPETPEVEKGYLLTAPTPKPNQEPPVPAPVQLWPLELAETPESRLEVGDLVAVELDAGESVYSLLDLDGGLVLAGLGSEDLGRRVALYRIACPQGQWELTECPLHAPMEEAAGGVRDRVWSLARPEGLAADPAGPARHRVVLGCDTGEIHALLLEAGVDGGWRGTWQPVGRMSSPVQALACRAVGEGEGTLRVFAGGTDGSVVTWQEIAGEGGKTAFASLWACHEGAAVTGLHPLRLSDEKGEHRMLLAITHEERCIFYDDRDRSTIQALKDHPSRVPFPGCRHGIFQRSLDPSTAFASCLAGAEVLPADPKTGRVAALLTASKHGVVRLLSLHYPSFMEWRRRQFRGLLGRWWAAVETDRQMRLVHAVFQAAPTFELILVRWLLDPSWPKEVGGSPAVLELWMLPRNLRSLLAVRRAWDDRNLEDLERYLTLALREAFRLDDLRLFQEICETVLKRGNFEPSAARGGKEAVSACQIYLEVYDIVERSLRLWRGSPGRQESLVRVTVIRSMVDGETFWSILEAAARELAGGEGEPVFGEVVRRRIQGFSELVFSRDPLVSLEALRSANLSLLRLCRRLFEERGTAGWVPLGPNGDHRGEIRWDGVFEPYFQALTAAAVRAFRSRLELNDALALGYARTFALAVCACPSAAVRIASRLSESRLISDPQSGLDLPHQVMRQLEVLDSIGVSVPEAARELFRMATLPPEGGGSLPNPWRREEGFWLQKDPWLKKNLPELGEAPHPRQADTVWKKVGFRNALDLYCLGKVYQAVEWCARLEDVFLRSPEKVAAVWKEIDTHGPGKPGTAAGQEIAKLDLEDPDVQDLYGHSAAFWHEAIGQLIGRLGDLVADDPPAEEILRPETVLASREVRDWAAQWIADLRLRYRQGTIFQPDLPVYLEALDRLRRAAESFPDSAAVRTKVVQGVLGHHLIEDLDEHILELEEIAHVLDPLRVRQYRREGRLPEARHDPPIAQAFADYLIERSHRAGSIPENLRTLFSMLGRQEEGGARIGLETLLKSFHFSVTAQQEALVEPLEPEELRYLRLILRELERNHLDHTESRADPVCRAALLPGRRLSLELDFEFPVSEQEVEELQRQEKAPADETAAPKGNPARLLWLQKTGLQEPIEPRPERTIKSSGMGLYLSNFAAAVVGWKLEIRSVEVRGAKGNARGSCRFRLEQVWGHRREESRS